MEGIVFVLLLAILQGFIFNWALRCLPAEEWQMMAVLPTNKVGPTTWKGLNLTYYGAFISIACVYSCAIGIVLLRSIGIPVALIIAIITLVLIACVPASRVLAQIVERRNYTLTIGGALFVGVLMAPLVIEFSNLLIGSFVTDLYVPTIPFLAALAIAYATGEGFGRLACISFGCCYGKPLVETSPLIRNIFSPLSIVFYGHTKKIAYEGGLEGLPVVPVQGITAIWNSFCGLLGMLFYFSSSYSVAFLLPIAGTQLWRFVSEFFRADFRGHGSVSAYQIMSLFALAVSSLIVWAKDGSLYNAPDLYVGIMSLWDPMLILFLIAVGISIFILTGLSEVTGSTITFSVVNDKIKN